MRMTGGVRKLAENATTLYVAHFVGLVVPLVTIPYLARVLRPESFGLVVFAQSFGMWLVLVLEYGFDLSGTRSVARVLADGGELDDVVAGVQSAKILVFLLSIPLVVGALWLVPLFSENPEYLLWAWLFAGARGFLPNWFFFGQERMAPPAFLEAGGRVLAAAGIFLLVHEPRDGWRVLALQAVGMGGAVAWLTFLMHREVPFPRLRVTRALRTLREAFGIFVFRSSSGLYMQANPFILGLLAPTQVVAFFGGAEKIVRAAVALIQPLSQTFFPRLSHLVTKDTRKAGGIFRVTVFSIVGLGLIMGLTTFVAAPVLVKLLLGPGYEEAVPVLRILAVLPPVIGVGTAFGIQWALPVGLERPFYSLVIAAGVVNVGLAVLLVPGFGGEGMALAVLAAEVLVAAGLLSLFRLKGGSFRPLRLPDTALDSGD